MRSLILCFNILSLAPQFLCILLRSHGSFSKPLVISSSLFLKHKSPSYHPENPDRLNVCLEMIKELESKSLINLKQPSGELNKADFDLALSVINRVHDPVYVKRIKHLSSRGARFVDPWDEDTYINTESFHQGIIAQSAWIDGCNEVVKNQNTAFAVVRPPGHHASYNKSMGFCLFNFAVGAATYAIDELGINRVSILDFDVHYGNGIADLVSSNPKIRYASIHQFGIFPYGRGSPEEIGEFNNIRNIPLSGGEKWEQYEPLLVHEAIPFLKANDPELVIVSGGYDALSSDELSSVLLQPTDFKTLAKHIREVFGEAVLFGLEGGYSVTDLPKALKETILAFTLP